MVRVVEITHFLSLVSYWRHEIYLEPVKSAHQAHTHTHSQITPTNQKKWYEEVKKKQRFRRWHKKKISTMLEKTIRQQLYTTIVRYGLNWMLLSLADNIASTGEPLLQRRRNASYSDIRCVARARMRLVYYAGLVDEKQEKKTFIVAWCLLMGCGM